MTIAYSPFIVGLLARIGVFFHINILRTFVFRLLWGTARSGRSSTPEARLATSPVAGGVM